MLRSLKLPNKVASQLCKQKSWSILQSIYHYHHHHRCIVRCSRSDTPYPSKWFMVHQRRAGTHQKHEECKQGSPKIYYIIGTMVLGAGTVIVYANYDPEFRKWMDEQVPGFDTVVGFAFQEDGSYMDYIGAAVQRLKSSISDKIYSMAGQGSSKGSKLPPCDEPQAPYKPPRSVYKPLLDQGAAANVKKTVDEHSKVQFLSQTPSDVGKKTADAVSKKAATVKGAQVKNLPLGIVELELAVGEAAKLAISAQDKAICAVRDHADKILAVLEKSVDRVDDSIWPQIRKLANEREEKLKLAEQLTSAVIAVVDKLENVLDNPNTPGTEKMKATARRNNERVLSDVNDAKEKLALEQTRSIITDQCWDKVEVARNHFSEELETLVPGVRLSEKKLKLSEGELDLFILYAFQNILYYQRELCKLETIGKMKLDRALAVAKLGDPQAIDAVVDQELELERRKLALEFQKSQLSVRNECEQLIRSQLKRQAEAHADHLAESIALKEKTLERGIERRVQEKVLEVQTRSKEQLAGMIGKLKGIDDAIKIRSEQDRKAHQSQILWSACQSLVSAIKASTFNKPWSEQLRPLQNEINAIKKAGADDELVSVVVGSIPGIALNRGVYPEAALRERFLKVERVAMRVAIVPEGGTRLPMLLISYLQSFLIIKSAQAVPAHELANELIDTKQLNTYDILQRARYWLDRGDFEKTLRYMNLLRGGARAVASDWMTEARIMLETQQAADTLLAHASASGLAYS